MMALSHGRRQAILCKVVLSFDVAYDSRCFSPYPCGVTASYVQAAIKESMENVAGGA
jgi:hypothetical protein